MIKKQKFYFLHIPKTAGTSVIAWLSKQENFNLCPDGLWSLLLKREHASLKDYNLYAGHFYTYLDSYLKCDLTTFTFLRHPVGRAISHYLHIRRDKAHYLHEHALRLDGFMGFMQDSRTMPMICNFQTRALSMRFDITKIPKRKMGFMRERYPIERYIECTMEGYETKANLSQAMRYLDNCCCVGITERMEESVQKLGHALGLATKRGAVPFLNTAQAKQSNFNLSCEEYNMLMRLVADDMALYKYANSILSSHYDHFLRPELRRHNAVACAQAYK